MHARFWPFLLALATALSCGSEEPPPDVVPSPVTGELVSLPSPFSPLVKRIVVEVDYALGAEPLTGTLPTGEATWSLLAANVNRLFEGQGKEIVVPTSLDQMEALDDVHGESFSPEDIQAIASRHQGMRSTQDTAVYYLVWLAGYRRSEEGVHNGTLGVSLSRFRVTAVFKPAFTDENPSPEVAPYYEQQLLVHEFGHSIGLVNNPLPMMFLDHLSPYRGAHCSNKNCIMYHELSFTFLSPRIETYEKGGGFFLFGPECLKDVTNARGKTLFDTLDPAAVQ